MKHAERRPQNTRELIELLSQPITGIFPVHKGPFVILPKTDAAELAEAPVVAMKEEPAVEMGAPAAAGAAPVMASVAAAPVMAAVAAAPARSIREVHPFFSRYEYDPGKALIGKGGFARVYRALDKKLNRWVALKFYKSADISERCSPTAEIQRVINLDHPNICRYLDIEEIEKENVFGEPEVTQVCVMELLDDGNLLEYYASHPTEAVLKKLLTDVLNGLAYLHKNGIIHRDIKPANILIRETSDGAVAKITDFGVSKVLDAAKTEHSSALVVSIPYMAPEQLNVKKYGIDERIAPNLDLWALGVTIYEVITGKVLFKKDGQDSNEEMMSNILSPELVDRVDELPHPFREVVRRCLVKDARRRVQRAEELIEVLHRPVAAPPQPNVERMPQEPVLVNVERLAAEPVRAMEGAPSRERVRAKARVEEWAPVEEAIPEVEIRPEMRLIPETGPVTQDLFVPEKSWVWAEAVSAPMPDEPARAPAAQPGLRIWDDGQRIAIIAATILIMIAVYIIVHNHRMSQVLHTLPTQDNATSMKYNGLGKYH